MDDTARWEFSTMPALIRGRPWVFDALSLSLLAPTVFVSSVRLWPALCPARPVLSRGDATSELLGLQRKLASALHLELTDLLALREYADITSFDGLPLEVVQTSETMRSWSPLWIAKWLSIIIAILFGLVVFGALMVLMPIAERKLYTEKVTTERSRLYIQTVMSQRAHTFDDSAAPTRDSARSHVVPRCKKQKLFEIGCFLGSKEDFGTSSVSKCKKGTRATGRQTPISSDNETGKLARWLRKADPKGRVAGLTSEAKTRRARLVTKLKKYKLYQQLHPQPDQATYESAKPFDRIISPFQWLDLAFSWWYRHKCTDSLREFLKVRISRALGKITLEMTRLVSSITGPPTPSRLAKRVENRQTKARVQYHDRTRSLRERIQRVLHEARPCPPATHGRGSARNDRGVSPVNRDTHFTDRSGG